MSPEKLDGAVADGQWDPPTPPPSSSPEPIFPDIIGEAPRMRAVYAIMQKIAKAPANVCIQGENGTGKELIAQALHYSGPRRARPFVVVDCTAIAEGLMESHLFGHVRGAFTGAVATVPGVFARAHTGTLFFDEIAEIPLHLQAKLLRATQTREFTMVGGTQRQHVDVRIIAATNRDLREAVRAGSFREDLYYRIAVAHIHLPPLRERKTDIPLLVAHFLRRFVKQYGKPVTGVTVRAIESLSAYSWPGNVRQLENCLEQAFVLGDGNVIDIEHLSLNRPEVQPRPLASAPHGLPLRELERWYVLETLSRVGGNRSKAARILDISLRGLQYKLRRYAVG
jgi:transcriptional regulator with PAS, ATPase and Fis domain